MHKFNPPSWQPVPPADLAKKVSERLIDPRWREPLLFAFGEFSLFSATQWHLTLEELHRSLGQQPSEDEAITLTRLLGEVPPSQIKEQIDGLRSVVVTLVECYSLHGGEYSADTRWRLAEALAVLRRRSEIADSQLGEVNLGTLVDQVIRGILQERKDLAAPLAYLLLSRYWLSAPTLEVLRKIQRCDKAEWGWPILTALQQSIPANTHLTVDPIPLANPPSDEDNDLHRRKARYAAVRERWQQQITAKDEREQDSLVVATDELELIWRAAQSDGAFLRVILALFGMAQNLEAVRWLQEYQDIALFLQKPDSAREAIIDAEPERFLWRFGNEDAIYSAAVYLDTSPGGRFKRYKTAPEFGPQFAVRDVDVDLLKLVKQAAKSASPAQELRRLIEADIARLSHSPDTRIAAELLGIEMPSQVTDEEMATIAAACYLISDATFRALNTRLDDWLSQKRDMTDAEIAALYGYLLDMQGRAGRGTSQGVKVTAGTSALRVLQCARQWRYVFEGTEDTVYDFAVCLDTLGPAKAGELDRPGAAALVSHILAAEALGPLLGPIQEAPLWGISSEERVRPWEYWQRLYELCLLACEIQPDFGQGLLDLFSMPDELSAVVEEELHPIREMLTYQAVEDEFVPLVPAPVRSIGPLQDWISTAAATHVRIETVVQEFEYRIKREGITLDQSLQSEVEDLAARLGEVSEFDRCLFLLRTARGAERDIASRWTEIAFAGLENVPDLYAQAELLRRFRINSPTDLPPAYHQCLSSLKSKSQILAAFAEGRLGSYLCNDSFEWNRDDALRYDAAWCCVSAFAALQEKRAAPAIRIDMNTMWRSLQREPQLALVRELLTYGIEGGLECSLEAFECLRDLCSRADKGGLYPERLIPLTRRPTTAALDVIRGWMDETHPTGTLGGSLRQQGAILIAEAHYEFPPSLVDALLDCLEGEDDLMAFRAELALAGPRRDVERETRRNSLKHVPWEHLAYLCQKTVARTSDFVRHTAGLAINSWHFDDHEKVAEWCAVAAPGSNEELALTEAMQWVEVWSDQSLRLVCDWALAHPASRGIPLIQLAGRLLSLERLTPEVESALGVLSSDGRVRQIRCPRWSGRNSEDMDAAVLEACVAAVSQFGGQVPTMPEDNLYPGNGEAPDWDAVRRVGTLAYHTIGMFPEQTPAALRDHIDKTNFAEALIKWLERSLQELSNVNRAQRCDIEARSLRVIISSLLSLATSLSAARPSLFAQLADPDQLAPLLGRVCVCGFASRSMMGAITLLFRLRRIDLTRRFVVDDSEHSLLDAVIACLNFDSQTRQRTESVLPQAVGLQGGPILEELGSILNGTSQRPGARRASVVLACARIIRTLIDTDALLPKERTAAGDLLRRAAQDERHRRPLYQKTGLGNEKEPMSYVYVGMLDEELARVLARRSGR